MNNEQEFLNGMWRKVEILEQEEKEIARIKETNRKHSIKSIIFATIVAIIFLIISTYPYQFIDYIYPLTIGILLIAFIIEYSNINSLEDKKYGNNNI